MMQAATTSNWDGQDRRSSCEDKFFKLMEQHTEDEMDRYDQIINKINANDDKSIKRHDETHERISHLTQSIESFLSEQSTFHDAIKRAFPKDDEGKPDYDGHRGAHLSWISNAKDEMEVIEYVRKQMVDSGKSEDLRQYVKKVALAAAAIAVGSWFVLLIWQGALHGPVK
jgi:hypothetical protein